MSSDGRNDMEIGEEKNKEMTAGEPAVLRGLALAGLLGFHPIVIKPSGTR